jgi:hypothetical protein
MRVPRVTFSRCKSHVQTSLRYVVCSDPARMRGVT